MEEIYNKWQLTELELRNIEPVRFTKEELLDFANYYYKKQLNIGYVSISNDIDYKKAFELALNYINSKPLRADTTTKEITSWNNLTSFIDKHNIN